MLPRLVSNLCAQMILLSQSPKELVLQVQAPPHLAETFCKSDVSPPDN
jgi:hypothetical protein